MQHALVPHLAAAREIRDARVMPAAGGPVAADKIDAALEMLLAGHPRYAANLGFVELSVPVVRKVHGEDRGLLLVETLQLASDADRALQGRQRFAPQDVRANKSQKKGLPEPSMNPVA